MNVYPLLKTNHLTFELTRVGIRELFFLNSAPCDIYIYKDGLFETAISKNSPLNNEVIKLLLTNNIWYFFVPHIEYKKIQNFHIHKLRLSGRSLSVGNPLIKGTKHLNLLSLCFSYLYQDPANDELLSTIFQSIQNFAVFLCSYPEIIPSLFKELKLGKHHYTITQPLISSLLLLAYLKHTNLFNQKDIEMLFVTSYFKDIGMSLIPEDKFYKSKLTPTEKNLFKHHPDQSSKILKGRVPLTNNHLNIISGHHFFHVGNEQQENENEDIYGIETLMVSVSDVITATTTDRPYREKQSIYVAMEKVKNLMAKEYPQEFRFLIKFLQRFFH